MDGSTVRETTVETIHDDQLLHGAVVDASTPLTDVVETLHFQGSIRAIYVVDPSERYVGLITRADLAGWLQHNLPGEPATDAGWDALGEALSQARAEDAIHPKSHEIPVEPQQPIEHALGRMRATALPLVPVVAPDGDLEGELTITRVLTYITEHS